MSKIIWKSIESRNPLKALVVKALREHHGLRRGRVTCVKISSCGNLISGRVHGTDNADTVCDFDKPDFLVYKVDCYGGFDKQAGPYPFPSAQAAKAFCEAAGADKAFWRYREV